MWHGGIGGLGTLAAFGKVWCGIGELGECGIGALGHWAYLEGDRPAVGVAARPVKGADAAARTKEVPGDAAAQQVYGEHTVSAWWVYGVCMAGDAAAELGGWVKARVRVGVRATARARIRASRSGTLPSPRRPPHSRCATCHQAPAVIRVRVRVHGLGLG